MLGLDGMASLTPQEQAARVRAAIGLRRMLLVIDDASTAEAGLLRVGGPHCAHLFTTRQASLAINLAGANTFAVGEVSVQDAQVLLARFAPALASAPGLAQLVNEASGMPLALALIGHHLQRLTRLGRRRAPGNGWGMRPAVKHNC